MEQAYAVASDERQMATNKKKLGFFQRWFLKKVRQRRKISFFG